MMMGIKKSAGILLVQNNKILLCHPTLAPWKNTYSIPKGGLEKGETIVEAAIRETKEEVGIEINLNMIDENDFYIIEYRNKHNKKFKTVHYFIVRLDDNILPEIFPEEMLQLDEVDWAGFLTFDEAKEKIFWRFRDMLQFVKNKKLENK